MPKPMFLANNRLRSTGTAVLTVAFACGLASAAHAGHHVDAHPRVQALRVPYQAAIGHMLARLGVDGAGPASRTASRAGGVMALETASARSRVTR